MKLSIITATYNNVAGLEMAFKSVQDQKCTDIEHIIIDNLSMDGTEQLVAQYKQKALYPVVYVREKDTGIYNALNKGIHHARGEWIHFLHSDDQYVLGVLNSLVFPQFDKDFELLAYAVEYAAIEQHRARIVYPEYDKKYKFLAFLHTGTFIKRSVFETYGYYDERYRVISDVIHVVKHYHKLRYFTSREIVIKMSGEGISSRFNLVNQYERMILYWFYLKAPWGERFKVVLSFVKQYILKQIKKRKK